MARIEWMGGWAPVPIPVAEAIRAKRVDPKLYRVRMSGGLGLNGRAARIEWVGAGTDITPEIAQAIIDDCTGDIPALLTAEIEAAFARP